MSVANVAIFQLTFNPMLIRRPAGSLLDNKIYHSTKPSLYHKVVTGSHIVMDKIAPLKSSEVPETFAIFKMFLSFIEKGWVEMNDRVNIEAFQSSRGHIFSYICHQNDRKQIDRIDFLLDSDASLEEIDNLLDDFLRKTDITNLSLVFQVNLQSRHFDYFFQGVNQRIGLKYSENQDLFDHQMFIAPPSTPEEIFVPEGYILGSLLEVHVEVISAQWALDIGFPKASKGMMSRVMENIVQRPCFGIFAESDEKTPVAWLCLYSGGDAGMLHVREGHRGKGLARILLRNTLKVVQDAHGMECRLHACVKNDNTASLNLLLSEGWDLQPYNCKKFFFDKFSPMPFQ